MSRVSYKVMVTLSCRLPVNITDLEYTFQNRKIKSTVRREGKRRLGRKGLPSSDQGMHFFVVVHSVNRYELRSYNVPGFEEIKINRRHASCPQRNQSNTKAVK